MRERVDARYQLREYILYVSRCFDLKHHQLMVSLGLY